MTAVGLPARQTLRAPRAPQAAGRAFWRLVRLELRHNPMMWLLPVAIALFWFTTYRKTVAMPPMWNVRAPNLQSGAIVDFITPVVGAAAWLGSREARRRTGDLVSVTALPRAARLVASWAATTCWALVGYVGCVAVLYGVTAHQAAWGGPLWWPATVAAVSLPAFAALGFAAGTLLPSRFTAPVAAIAAFFVLALSTQLIVGSHSYWQVSPIVTGPWDTGPDGGIATFYSYLPDLSIAQVMFLVGLTIAVLAALVLSVGSGGRALRAAAAALTAAGIATAGTAVGLAGTGRLDSHGMITIAALHDSANDRPLRFTPVCSRSVIPVCLNPAYANYLPATSAALAPVLKEIAGLPGAPVKVMQTALTYVQGQGNEVSVGLTGPVVSGARPVYRLLLPDQLLNPPLTTGELARQVRLSAGPGLIASVIGDASPAQRSVVMALMMTAGLPNYTQRPGAAQVGTVDPAQREPTVGSPAYNAARRFGLLPASVRHAWLQRHLTALRAGLITLAQLP